MFLILLELFLLPVENVSDNFGAVPVTGGDVSVFLILLELFL
jgi:hypothetical protein